MAPPMMLKPGQTMKLPAGGNALFKGGCGWSPSGGVGESPDLDFWVVRRRAGVGEPIFWGNKDWQNPAAGTNSQGNPFVVTPEKDVLYKGDDRTGAESGTGYDENVEINPGVAPADVDQYDLFVTIYDEKGEGLTLGVAEDIVCGLVDPAGHEIQIKLAEDHGFDVTAHIGVLTRDQATGQWSLTSSEEGYPEDMFEVAKTRFAVEFPQRWLS